jgi:hypothetical protein
LSLLKTIIYRRFDKISLNYLNGLLVNEFYNLKNQNKKLSIKLKIFFFLIGFNLSKTNKNFIYYLIKSLTKLEKRKLFQNKTITLLKKIDFKNFSYKSLDLIYALILRLGLFEIGLEFRKILINKAISNLEKNNIKKNELIRGISALLELKKYNLALKYIHRLSNNEIKRIFLFFSHRFIKNKILNKSELGSYYNYKFRKIIKNKKILCIGPADTNLKKNLNKFDLTLKFNFFNYSIQKVNYKIENCDLSYLNTEQTNFYKDQNSIDKNIKFFITRSKKSEKDLKDTFKITNVRHTINSKQLIFRGNLNLLPNTILDLFCSNQKIKKIFITNSDLMLTPNRKINYYPKQWERESKMKSLFLEHSAISHDPITQFNILSKFYEIKFIEGDKVFENVMKSGLKKYLSKLEDIYGYKL